MRYSGWKPFPREEQTDDRTDGTSGNRILSIRGHRVIVKKGVDVEPSIW
jgi:hypothetical protein